MTTTALPLDPAHPEWGDSPYLGLALSGDMRLADLLTHLFVLIPVLDNTKHYYIGEDEVQKLLRKGEGWLDGHPERELIVRRYLKGFKSWSASPSAVSTRLPKWRRPSRASRATPPRSRSKSRSG